MRTTRDFTLTLFPVLSYAAAMHTALMLFAFREAPIADHVGMLIWWGFLIGYNMLLALFLRRPRELRSIVLLSGGVGLCQLAVTLYAMPAHPDFTWWLAAVGMWAACYYQCACAHWMGVKPEALMTNFETTVLTLFAAAFIISGGAMHIGVLPHLGVGLLCILTALIRLRTRHTRWAAQGGQPMARLLLPLLLLGTAGCAVLIVLLISGQAAALLTRFTAWLVRMGKLLADAVGAFFLWLFSLFPAVDGNMDADGLAGPALPSGAMEGPTQSNGVLLYVLIAVFAAALLLVLVKVWRTVRLQGQRQIRPASKAVVVKRRSMKEIVLRFFRRVARRVRFELRYLRGRNTAQGLLVWLERVMRRKRMGRKRGESVAAFLCRVSELLPDRADDLRELSRCLDRCYFGGGDTMPTETVREMRKKIRKALNDRK